MIMSKEYTVYVTKHYKPITIEADSQENAEKYAKSCIDLLDLQEVNALAVGKYQSKPVEDTEVRNSKNKW